MLSLYTVYQKKTPGPRTSVFFYNIFYVHIDVKITNKNIVKTITRVTICHTPFHQRNKWYTIHILPYTVKIYNKKVSTNFAISKIVVKKKIQNTDSKFVSRKWNCKKSH